MLVQIQIQAHERSCLRLCPAKPQLNTSPLQMSSSTSKATTPLRRLATHSMTTCATQAAAYGKCILGTYTDMKKDACKDEFEKFGKCMREAVITYSPFCTLETHFSVDETEMVIHHARPNQVQ